MDRIQELEKIIEIERNNQNVMFYENAKKRYASLCKEMDNTLLEYSKMEEAKVTDIMLLSKLIKLKADIENSFEYLNFTTKNYGNLEYIFDAVKKNKMKIINEELIQKALHPNRLMRYIELGGDIDDF